MPLVGIPACRAASWRSNDSAAAMSGGGPIGDPPQLAGHPRLRAWIYIRRIDSYATSRLFLTRDLTWPRTPTPTDIANPERRPILSDNASKTTLWESGPARSSSARHLSDDPTSRSRPWTLRFLMAFFTMQSRHCQHFGRSSTSTKQLDEPDLMRLFRAARAPSPRFEIRGG